MCTASKTGCWLQNNHGEPLNASICLPVIVTIRKALTQLSCREPEIPWALTGLVLVYFLPYARAKELQLMLAGEFLPLLPLREGGNALFPGAGRAAP